MRLAAIESGPLDRDELASAVSGPGSGAVVVFSGDVRNVDHGRSVARLEYEGHPSAGAVLAEVVSRVAAAAGPDVVVAAAHRVGPLAIGEAALVVAVGAEHRGAAFDVCSSLVDEIKRCLPIWKLQVFVDGTSEWENCA